MANFKKDRILTQGFYTQRNRFNRTKEDGFTHLGNNHNYNSDYIKKILKDNQLLRLRVKHLEMQRAEMETYKENTHRRTHKREVSELEEANHKLRQSLLSLELQNQTLRKKYQSAVSQLEAKTGKQSAKQNMSSASVGKSGILGDSTSTNGSLQKGRSDGETKLDCKIEQLLQPIPQELQLLSSLSTNQTQ